MEYELTRRARDAGYERLEEIRAEGGVDEHLIDEARENADKAWHRMGFDQHDGDADQRSANVEHSLCAADLEAEVLAAARAAVVDARAERGTDPTIVDALLRKLDGRGAPPV